MGIRSRARLARQFVRARVNPRPIFVLGNQKSGTSAIAGLLAKVADANVTLDFHCPTYREVVLGQRTMRSFVKRHRVAFSNSIIKEPVLTLMVPALKAQFPAAQLVLVVRDPRDNIRSVLDRLDLPGDAESLSQETLEGLPFGWAWNIDCRWAGIEGETYIDWMAERWNHFADVHLRDPEGVTLVRYEDFVADKEGVLRGLARNLGLPDDGDISSDLDRSFQPRGKRKKVPWPTFFGQANLARIEKRCGERMLRLGYATAEVK